MRKVFLCLLLIPTILISAQKNKKNTETKTPEKPTWLNSGTYSALKWRAIGPAVTSGRVGDLLVNPNNTSEWYIAAASGGVWKTSNAGTNFTPIFDGQSSFSIGCLAMDPTNSNVIWVGTGENNNQRSVAYGDGVYRSEDGGKSWTNVGLKNSEHVGMIAIHPTKPNIVFVAAYGPLWSKGGERGIYKTTDHGKTWKQVLFVSENTGCNEVHIDPTNPDIMYATAHQRRRHEWTYISGGPESGVYKSTDGGETWNKLKSGLPSGDCGRIGMDISPVNSDVLYAVIEATEDEKGFYRSKNRGASWEKMSGHSTAGNYYTEIICDPVNVDKVYSMDTWAQVTLDGGKTFKGVGEKNKHVDNHCIWIDKNNTSHILMGCDGGLYETWDHAKTWDFKSNLSITQFYRVAVDNATPFYNVYGGTQDNNTLGGPSRTNSGNGIQNSDWFVTVGGDGFEPAIDPTNPNIVYSQWQYGGLVRYDKITGEQIDIKPKEKNGEPAYRFNWDSPLLISKYDSKRIYFAANKVFRSDNRGDSWTVISKDLSRGIDRNKLPVMDKVWSIDAVAKNQSTSIYGNITALAESQFDEKTLYAGTDDGLIHITTDGGSTWKQVSTFGNVPTLTLNGITTGTFVENIVASKHDANVVYALFNNHRNGDFKPYVMKSADKGNTWTNISNDLPARGSSHCMAEDHINKNLLFVGTEFGIYFTLNGGTNWLAFNNGLPPIAVRDIEIQKRENDLVIATFGRGFYVLDDYSVLQNVKAESFDANATIFPIKDAVMFVPRTPLGHGGKSFQGESLFMTENPPVGATITYYIKNDYKTLKEKRKEREADRIKNNLPVNYPSLDSLAIEEKEEAPYILAIITDESGNVIRKLKRPATKGMQRFTWNGRMERTSPISFYTPNPDNPYESEDMGPLCLPGTYNVKLVLVQNGVEEKLTENTSFKLKPLYEPSIKVDYTSLNKFNKDLSETRRVVLAAHNYMYEMKGNISYLKEAAKHTTSTTLMKDILTLESELNAIEKQMSGDGTAARREFETLPGITGMLENIVWNLFNTSMQQTGTYEEQLAMVKIQFKEAFIKLSSAKTKYEAIERELERLGAPYTPGRFPEWK